MASEAKAAAKGVFTGDISDTTSFLFGDFEGGLRSGKSSAKRAQKAQKKAIAEQKRIEDIRLAEAESGIAKRKALGTRARAGRQSLIATSQTGRATNLGGSA